MRSFVRITVTCLAIAAAVSLNESCQYHNEEELYPKPIDTTTTPQPVDSSVSFASKVKPIFDNKCKVCHDNGSGRVFISASHSTVTAYLSSAAAEQDMKDRIDFLKGAIGNMPQGGPQLPLADRDLIKQWISQGKRNN